VIARRAHCFFTDKAIHEGRILDERAGHCDGVEALVEFAIDGGARVGTADVHEGHAHFAANDARVAEEVERFVRDRTDEPLTEERDAESEQRVVDDLSHHLGGHRPVHHVHRGAAHETAREDERARTFRFERSGDDDCWIDARAPSAWTASVSTRSSATISGRSHS
jgi:hypothetical protein